MATILLPAHFDGKQIILDEPFEMKADTKLFVTVVSPSDSERQDWLGLSAQRLGAAYGDEEPEYDLADIREVKSKKPRPTAWFFVRLTSQSACV